MAFIASHWFLWLILTVIFVILAFGGSIFGFIVGKSQDSLGAFFSGVGAMILGILLSSITGILFIIGLVLQIINYIKA